MRNPGPERTKPASVRNGASGLSASAGPSPTAHPRAGREVASHQRRRARAAAAAAWDRRGLFVRQEGRHLPRATAHHRRDRPVHEDDVGARRPREARVLALRPGERRAVGVRGVGGGENDGLRLVGIGLAERAQPVERAGVRELQAAEAGHEVAAADAAGLFEGLQHRVDRREPARDLLERDRVAGQDAVALQQLLGEGFRPLGGARGPARRRQEAPAAHRRGRDLPARAEARHAAPSLRARPRAPRGRRAAPPACRS